jgi:hypothetical protein
MARTDEVFDSAALRNLLLASTYVRQRQPDLDRVIRLGDLGLSCDHVSQMIAAMSVKPER